MVAVLFRFRAEARARWRSWLGLAVLAGVLGGATIAALTGARRTESAYLRFLRGTQAFDVMVTNGGTTPENLNQQFDFSQVAALPHVADAALLRYYFPSGTAPSGRPLVPGDLTPFASPDGRFGTELNRARVLDGRLPRAEDEVAVTFVAADHLDADVGESMRLGLTGASGTTDTRMFRVVGVVAIQAGFPPLTGGLPPPVLLSPAYGRARPDGAEVLAVRLHQGTAGIAAFEHELQRLAGGEQVVTTHRLELGSVVQRSLGVQATALRLLALVTGAVAMLLVAHAAGRQHAVDSEDHSVLRAVGFAQAQLQALGTVRALGVAVVAALLAAATAVALSPLTPVGVARQAELRPGVEVNVAHVASGGAAVLLLVLGLGALAAAWSTRRALRRRPVEGEARASAGVSGMLARAGFSAPAVCGVRMALQPGRSRLAVPVRSSIISAALGVATIVGVVTFSASLGRLFDSPRLYGWNWDVQLGDAFSPALDDDADRLSAHPAVGAVAVGTIARLQIGPLPVDTLAIEARRGTVGPTVVEGRVPAGPDEILLGTRTLREVGVAVGEPVTVAFGERTARMHVVGRGVLTEFAGAARLGEGAAMTLEGMRSVFPDAVADVVLLQLRSGSAADALRAELVTDPSANVYLPAKPSDLANLERVGGLPFVVAGLLGIMAVATLVHTLVTSVRRRRRDLAILKVVGFVRRQVSATVAWQATVLAVLAVVIGVPLGVGAGRWGWQLFADHLGVPPQPTTPLLLLLVAPAAVLVANLVAAVPARLAARTRPSAVLRSE